MAQELAEDLRFTFTQTGLCDENHKLYTGSMDLIEACATTMKEKKAENRPWGQAADGGACTLAMHRRKWFADDNPMGEQQLIDQGLN